MTKPKDDGKEVVYRIDTRHYVAMARFAKATATMADDRVWWFIRDDPDRPEKRLTAWINTGNDQTPARLDTDDICTAITWICDQYDEFKQQRNTPSA